MKQSALYYARFHLQWKCIFPPSGDDLSDYFFKPSFLSFGAITTWQYGFLSLLFW